MDTSIVILLSLIFSAFFSGMEIAFVSANKLRLELKIKQGGFNALVLSRLIKDPSYFIGTMLIGNNIALVVYGIAMAAILEPVIFQYTSNDIIVLAIQTVISTGIILLTAEFLPKMVFRINPGRTLRLFSVPTILIYYILFVPMVLIIWLSKMILRVFFKVNFKEKSFELGKVDLDNYVREFTSKVNEKEDLDHEIQIFQNALDFSDIKARECMIPRTELIAVEINDPIEGLQSKFIDTGLSKILVYKESIDHIIGYVHSSDLFKKPKNIRSILYPVTIVPETMLANDLLKLFIHERKSIAIVVDEFGGTSGIVTTEDIIEEIFGEIQDEHDTAELIEEKIDDNEFIFSGRLEIDDLNEKYKLDLPLSDEYETLGGLILQHTEKIPDSEEKLIINGYTITVLDVSDTRIEKVHLVINSKE